MNGLQRVFRFLNRWFDRGVLLCFLLCFFLGAYCCYDVYRMYQGVQQESLLEHKPGSDKDVSRPIAGRMAGWLTIPDTGIDYPVMQGEDNLEYLNKDPYGEYSLSGSLFLDSRNQPDFSDDYSLIYGHHMEHGLLFGALDDYLDADYLTSHAQGSILIDGLPEKRFRIFAAVEADALEEKIFAPTEVPSSDTYAYVKEYARVLDVDHLPEDGAKLIAFSTCKYPDTAGRTIVVGYFL